MKRTFLSWVAIATLLSSLTTFAQPDTLWTRDTGFVGEVGQIFETDDGGYLLLVNHWWTDSLGTVEFVKLSGVGDSLWSVPIEMPYEFDRCFYGDKCENGDIMLSGSSYTQEGPSSKYLIRVSQQGEILSTEASPYWFFAYTSDSSVVTVDDQASNDSVDFFVTRLAAGGDTLWNRAFNLDGDANSPFDLERDDDGRVYVIGWVDPANSSNQDGYVLCLGSDGDSLWYRQTDTEYSDAYQVGPILSDGSLVLVEHSQDHGQFLVKLDQQGAVTWRRSYAPSGMEEGGISEFFSAQNGGVIVNGAGNNSRSPWFFRIDDDGDILWETCCWRAPIYSRWISWATELSNGGFILAETLQSVGVPNPPKRVFLTRLSADPISDLETTPRAATGISLHPNYPNPFNPSTEITFDLPHSMQASLKVYDVLGREVAVLMDGVIGAGAHTVTFDASELSSGVYFYRLDADEFFETRKMVVMK